MSDITENIAENSAGTAVTDASAPLQQQAALPVGASPVQALTGATVVSGAVYQTQPTRSGGSGGTGADGQALPEGADGQAAAGAAYAAGLVSRQGFRVAGVGMVIDYIDASELIEVPSISYVPNTPEWYAGLVNLHGSVIPVLDLQRYLNLQDERQQPAASAPERRGAAAAAATAGGMTVSGDMMLVLGHNEDALGVFVDGLPARVYLDMDKANTDVALAPGRLTAYTRAVHHVDDEMWCELDCTKLLDDVEAQLQSHAGG